MVNSIYKAMGGSPGSEYFRVSVVSGSTSVTQHSEDDAHVSGDEGVFSLAVRSDTPANRSGTDGDYEGLQVSEGLLWTRMRGMQTPNGDSMVDDTTDSLNVGIVSGLTEATNDDAAVSSGQQVMAEYKDFDGTALPSPVDAEGDSVRIAASSRGVQYVMLVNEDGSEVGSIQQATHDNLNANANIQIANTDVADDNPVPVTDSYGPIGDGSKNVTTAGTAEAIAGSTPAKVVAITAKSSNGGPIAIGASGVVVGTDGMQLAAGQTAVLPVPEGDLQNIYIDVSSNGEGVTFTYWQ